MLKNTYENIKGQVTSFCGRSAWDKGVTKYAYEMLDELFEQIENGYLELDDIYSPNLLHKALLNGADDWKQSSEGGCYLICDSDIAERLCTPSELKRTKGGMRNPNSHESWIDVQARALRQAEYKIKRAFRICDPSPKAHYLYK